MAIERCGKQGRVIGRRPRRGRAAAGRHLPASAIFTRRRRLARIKAALDGPADLVLSDMAAPASGHAGTDHLRIMALAEAAFDFAEETLAPGGAFVVKLLQGGAEAGLLRRLKRAFAKLRHVKPSASRADSAELYLVATGFRGGAREALEAGD